jgi:hypothetical protein
VCSLMKDLLIEGEEPQTLRAASHRRPRGSDRPEAAPIAFMHPPGAFPLSPARRSTLLASLIYLALRRLLELWVVRRRSPQFKELEIVVLRHQLDVLRRRAGRPLLRRRDRAFLAAASCLLPRASWRFFFVQPETLLRWHRELLARRWSYARRSPGRGPEHIRYGSGPELAANTLRDCPLPTAASCEPHPRVRTSATAGGPVEPGIRMSSPGVQGLSQRTVILRELLFDVA